MHDHFDEDSPAQKETLRISRKPRPVQLSFDDLRQPAPPTLLAGARPKAAEDLPDTQVQNQVAAWLRGFETQADPNEIATNAPSQQCTVKTKKGALT